MTAPARPDLAPNEVMVGTSNGAGLWIAPEGTSLPEDGADFAAPWRSLGYASDDGPTLSGDTTSEGITPWQSRTPIRTIITERTQTVQFVLWQLNQDTLGLYFGAEVPAGDSNEYSFDVRSDDPSRIYAIAVDAKDGDSIFRVGYTRATLDSVGDLQLQKGAAVPLDVTLSALDDAGTLCTVYVKVGAATQALALQTTPGDTPADVNVTASSSGPSTLTKPTDQPAPDQPAPDDDGVATGPSTDAAEQGTTADTGTTDTGSEV